jgi:hypothetical protein
MSLPPAIDRRTIASDGRQPLHRAATAAADA